MRRKFVPAVVASVLLLVFFLFFLNLTEVDTVLRQALRAVVPQEVQNVLRPLRAPMVIDYSPDWEATDVALRSPVSITFLTPMNAAATEANVTIEPAIAGEFSWRGTTLVFTPDEDWPMQQEVIVSVTREARSWLLRRMERGFTFGFTTLGPPVVVETEPSQDARFAYLEDRLTITFNRPMDEESVERRLSVTPEIARQRLAWSDEQLIISGVLTPSTEYHVVICRGVQDAVHGMRTVEDFEWTFTTTERYPYLAITGVGKEALLTAGRPVSLAASLVNVSRVDVELYAIDLPSYIAMSNFSSEDWRQFAPEDLPISSWSLEPEVELDRDEERTLELEALEPGIYYLAAGSPEGPRDGQILISTKIALTLKRSSRQALVWATSMEDGQPVAGLALTLYDGEGQVVATGVSDEEGIFAADIPSSVEQLHVAGDDEGVVALCSDGWREGVEPWRFENVLWSWESEQSEYRVQLYTDRPTYRPGDRVNFRGVLRLDDDGEYSLPPAGSDVQVTAANYKDNLIYEEELETSPFGTVHGSFLLNEEVVPGEYFLEATVGGEEHQIVFRIEEYEEERFAVSVMADQPAHGNGDVISATVRAEYSFGAPVVGATVEYTVYSSEYPGPWEEQGAGECDTWSCWAYGREIAVGTGFTDEEGRLQLSLRAGATRGSQSQLLSIGATVTDASGQHAMATTRVPIHRGQFYVGLQPKRLVVGRGQRAVVDVRTVDTEGEPLGDLPISYTVRLGEWQQVPRTVEGRTYMEWQEIISEVASSKVVSDSEGQATIGFVPERGGHYQVEARGRDEAGNSILAETELWVSDPDRVTAWRVEEHDRIGLVTDQETYQPGDVARVLVQSPYAQAAALVTVERGEMMSYHVTELESNSAILEIPVESEYAPNVFVSVTLVPRHGAGGDGPGFKVGYAELAVEAPEDLLHITVVPDKSSYQPGEMASYTIRTRDAANRPVSAEVSLDVVDASGLTSGGEETDDIVGTFRGRRRLAVRTSQSLAIHVDRKHLVEDYGGGGGIEEQEPQLVFPQVAYWNPAIVTDDTGVARVSFQMPDSLTAWRALVRGITVDSEVGAAEADVSTEKELAVRPHAPGFLYVGDEVVFAASLENHTEGPLQVQVSLISTEGLSVTGSSRTLIVVQAESAAVEWTARAEQAGPATLTMIAEAGEYRDVAQVKLDVLPFGERTEVLDSYILDDEVRHLVTVPEGAQALSLQVDLAPSLSVALADSLEYLRDYPHGSVEQVVSRFLPDLVLDEVASELSGGDTELTAELPEVVESSLQRLYRLQSRDGGWGWSGSDDSQVWQTAYVVYGLSRAQGAGYEVNERVLGRGVDWLQQSLTETRDLDEKACVLHVLAEMGEGDLSLARSLAERRRNMDLHAQARLALALDALGDPESALRIVEDLAYGVVETAHTAHWTEASHDPAAMSSDGQTTALVLRALLEMDPESPLVAKAARWLMWTRQGAHWGSTYETSEIVQALAEYVRATGESARPLDYQAFLDGEVLTSDRMTLQERGGLQELTVTGLEPGEHQLLLVNEGEEAIYVSTALRYSVDTGTLGPARSLNGPLIERRYEVVGGGASAGDWRVGDLVRVRVTVELPADAWYVVVEDPLPAGAQVVQADPELRTLGDSPREQPTPASSFGEEQAVFFATWLPAGVHEYSYLVQATMPGQLVVMPAEAVLTYDPESWGRSGDATVRITG